MSLIFTYCGKSFDPFRPAEADIDPRDIAHALSLLCRANGHIDHFYSVAQHSLNCLVEARVRGYSTRTQRFCLLHDAAESYLSDLTRPVKEHFPLYREAETRLQRVIFSALGAGVPTEEEWKAVGEIDDCLLAQEFLRLRGIELFDRTPELKGDCDFSLRPPAEVERRFLKELEQFPREEEGGTRPV